MIDTEGEGSVLFRDENDWRVQLFMRRFNEVHQFDHNYLLIFYLTRSETGSISRAPYHLSFSFLYICEVLDCFQRS